jgi:hypothetical protein
LSAVAKAAKAALERMLDQLNSTAKEGQRLLEVARATSHSLHLQTPDSVEDLAQKQSDSVNAVRYLEGRHEQAMRDIALITSTLTALPEVMS